MSYQIYLTNNTLFATIADGTINQSSSMTLIGKNYANYGQFLDDNFIHLLENSSNTTPPTSPITGQLWWDSGNSLLKVYNGSSFKVISAATASSTAPTSNVAGDLWFDSSNSLLKVYTGTGWLTVGPSSVNGTGAVPAVIYDNAGSPQAHNVIQLTVGNTIVGMISADTSAYTPNPAISGFSTIKPGLQLSTSSPTYLFQGTAVNATTLDGYAASDFILASGGALANLTVSGAMTVGGGLINSAGNGVSNIGGAGAYFNTVFAKATSAQYADVAERFAADEVYEAGTVVELGGSAEITKVDAELSNKVFGVISTRAAYLMNAGAGDDQTHPPVAMTGRVPVRVIGKIRKGDRLVSAGNGIARSALEGEVTAFNSIGRALADKNDDAEGTVEAIVTIK
jgi:hypothetical protein